MSAYARIDTGATTDFNVLFYYGKDSYVSQPVKERKVLTTAWQRVSWTFTAPSAEDTSTYDNGSTRIFIGGIIKTPSSGTVTGSGTVYITGCKLEIGSKATDWTPASEDVPRAVDTLFSVNEDVISLRANKKFQITSGGTFTVDAANYQLTDKGTVSITGGSIGGFTIGKNVIFNNNDDDSSKFELYTGGTSGGVKFPASLSFVQTKKNQSGNNVTAHVGMSTNGFRLYDPYDSLGKKAYEMDLDPSGLYIRETNPSSSSTSTVSVSSTGIQINDKNVAIEHEKKTISDSVTFDVDSTDSG